MQITIYAQMKLHCCYCHKYADNNLCTGNGYCRCHKYVNSTWDINVAVPYTAQCAHMRIKQFLYTPAVLWIWPIWHFWTHYDHWWFWSWHSL